MEKYKHHKYKSKYLRLKKQIGSNLIKFSKKVEISIPVKPLTKEELGLYKYDEKEKIWKKVLQFSKKTSQKRNLKILTYNIWGALKDIKYEEYAFDIRKNAVMKIIENSNADIVCLQEVNAHWLNFFRENEFIKKNYYSIESGTNRVTTKWGLSTTIFSKIPLYNVMDYGLPSLQMDNVLICNFDINNKKYTIATSQLHSSKEWTQFRILQLQVIFDLLKSEENVIFAGDFNFGDGQNWIENDYIDQSYTDVWKQLKPYDPGYTEDTYINIMRFNIKKKHKQERFDKVLYKSSHLNPTSIELKGMERIKHSKLDTWPSDHWAVLSKFSL